MKGEGPGQPVRRKTWAAGPRSQSGACRGHCKMVTRIQRSMKKGSRKKMEDQAFQPLRQ